MKQFELTSEFIELNKLLKVMQMVSTGGEANVAILLGMVKVNGTTASEKRKKIRKGDQVLYKKQIIEVI